MTAPPPVQISLPVNTEGTQIRIHLFQTENCRSWLVITRIKSVYWVLEHASYSWFHWNDVRAELYTHALLELDAWMHTLPALLSSTAAHFVCLHRHLYHVSSVIMDFNVENAQLCMHLMKQFVKGPWVGSNPRDSYMVTKRISTATLTFPSYWKNRKFNPK